MKTPENTNVAAEVGGITKNRRVRSPAYPTMGLADAIDKAKILYTKEAQGRHPITASVIAKDWEYKSLNGSALTAISALKQFGLLIELDVPEDKPRQFKLSNHALNLVVRKPDSDEWKDSAKAVAMLPKLYVRLWKKYGWPLPSDDSVRHYLELDEKFNVKHIPSIIKEYKKAIALASLSEADKIVDVGEGESGDDEIEIGDFIQWESGGKLAFAKPRVVTGFSDDRSHLFVDEQPCGIPITEAIRAEAPTEEDASMNLQQDEHQRLPATPPANPNYKVKSPPLAVPKTDKYAADAGDVIVSWPPILSQAECEEIDGWLDMLKKKIKRSVKRTDSESPAPNSAPTFGVVQRKLSID